MIKSMITKSEWLINDARSTPYGMPSIPDSIHVDVRRYATEYSEIPIPSHLAFKQDNVSGTPIAGIRAKGLPVYEETAVITGDEKIGDVERAFYYDSKGRVIQTVEKNHFGKISRYSTKYDFVGNVLESNEAHESLTTPPPAGAIVDIPLMTDTYLKVDVTSSDEYYEFIYSRYEGELGISGEKFLAGYAMEYDSDRDMKVQMRYFYLPAGSVGLYLIDSAGDSDGASIVYELPYGFAPKESLKIVIGDGDPEGAARYALKKGYYFSDSGYNKAAAHAALPEYFSPTGVRPEFYAGLTKDCSNWEEYGDYTKLLMD